MKTRPRHHFVAFSKYLDSHRIIGGQEEPLCPNIEAPAIEPKSQCSACPLVNFDSMVDLKRHYQCDWHVHNLRAKLSKGRLPVLDNEEYLQYANNSSSIEMDNNFDDESDEAEVSGEEGPKTGSPFVSLCVVGNDGNLNTEYLVYKRALFEEEECKSLVLTQIPNFHDFLLRRFMNLMESVRILILIRSGRVAAGVYSGSKCLAEKTIKKYTTRAKQGGSQSARDNSSSGRIRSAGASIRRANEIRLVEEVRELLGVKWASYLNQAAVIFYLPTRSAIDCLFGDCGNVSIPLEKKDPRLRTIPLTTYQPSIAEMHRVENLLFSVHMAES